MSGFRALPGALGRGDPDGIIPYARLPCQRAPHGCWAHSPGAPLSCGGWTESVLASPAPHRSKGSRPHPGQPRSPRSARTPGDPSPTTAPLAPSPRHPSAPGRSGLSPSGSPHARRASHHGFCHTHPGTHRCTDTAAPAALVAPHQSKPGVWPPGSPSSRGMGPPGYPRSARVPHRAHKDSLRVLITAPCGLALGVSPSTGEVPPYGAASTAVPALQGTNPLLLQPDSLSRIYGSGPRGPLPSL